MNYFNGFMEQILDCLRFEAPLAELLPRLADALRKHAPINALALLRPGHGDKGGSKAPLIWSADPNLPVPELQGWFADAKRLAALPAACGPSGLAGPEAAALWPEALRGAVNSVLLPLRLPDQPPEFLLVNKEPARGPWHADELRVLHLFSALLAVFSAGQAYCAGQAYHNRVFNAAMDQVRACIYITDPRTDRILYMNQSMKEAFRLDRPEGKICWQVLQQGKTQRCEFCPVSHLEEHPDDQHVYRWEEHNTLTGHLFENYDSLMRWIDGSRVHLQQSIDITDTRRLQLAAQSDELTGLLNRRAGIEKLSSTLGSAKTEDASLIVALLDVNDLKSINDAFGHMAGDQALRLVAKAVEDSLREPDFCFRLSGDEFIVVFHALDRHAAGRELEAILDRLKAKQEEIRLGYALSFCFGCFEVRPGLKLAVPAILSKADESMYEQKKKYHISIAAQRLKETAELPPDDILDYNAAQLYEALCRSTDAYIYVSKVPTGVFRYSKSMVRDFGLPGEIVPNAAAVWGEYVHPDDKAAFLESNQIIADGKSDVHCVEYRVKNREGQWVWVRCRGYLVHDEKGAPALFAGFISNLGQKNKIDHITGLPNKIAFEEEVTAALQNRPGAPLRLMLLGVDNFKHVNELHGRFFGDEVLRIIAQKLQVMLPENDALYRLDGDIFAVVLNNDARDARDFYDSVAESFRYQQEYDGKKYFCPLSAGYARYPEDATGIEELFQAAMCALTNAKKNGRNRITFFSRRLRSDQKRALELTELLRESIECQYEGFELFYQPQVTAENGALVGAEALARWNCPKYGPVSPVEFIPLMERSGLIVPFGEWVFREAVAQCKKWTRLQPDFVISVNLSYLQVISDDMLPFIKATLEKHDLSPRNLVVEFTESCMIRENTVLQEIFQKIRSLGIRIAMDDFGTGYSSLSMLKTSPADTVKIDRAFVRDILNSRFDATFIRFVVALCHDVDIKVCLEGVEREEELQLVQPMQLDYIQGYLFGRPMDAARFQQEFFAVGKA